METINEIKKICIETKNTWFLSHQFPQIALYDLDLKERLEKEENITNFDERECSCFDTDEDCIECSIEEKRTKYLDDLLGVRKYENEIYRQCYDEENCVYFKSKWIIPEKINGEMSGFMLIQSYSSLKSFTHELVFVCVRPKFRKKRNIKEYDSINS